MNAWAFVTGAYAIAGIGTFGLLLWAWRSMRAAESQADQLKRRP